MMQRRRTFDQISTASAATAKSSSSSRRQPSLSMLLLLVLLAISTSSITATQLRGQQKSRSQTRLFKHQTQRHLSHLKLQHQKTQCSAVQQKDEGCAAGAGSLVCEYDPLEDTYATRCVKRNAVMSHVGFHVKNYCGSCNKCFETREELDQAVDSYLTLGEDERRSSSVAQTYGYPMDAWCVDKITDLSNLFHQRTHFNEDISHWDVSRVTDMTSTFAEAYMFKGDLSLWNTSSVTSFRSTFDRAYAFTGTGLQYWDTSSAIDMTRMFRMAKHFQEDISAWDISSVTSLSRFLYRAEHFNHPLGDWDVSQVEDFAFMFAFGKEFQQDLSSWDTSSARTFRGMFQHADAFAQDLTCWKDQLPQLLDTAYMFENAMAFQQQSFLVDGVLQAWAPILEHQVQDRDEMFGSHFVTVDLGR